MLTFSRKEISTSDQPADCSTTRTSAQPTARNKPNRARARSTAKDLSTPRHKEEPNIANDTSLLAADRDRLLANWQQPQERTPFSSVLRLAPAVAGLIAIASGVLVMLGWILGIEILKTGLPGLVPMKPNTAFCFIFAGGALYVLTRSRIDLDVRAKLAGGLALVPLTIGFVTLLEHFFGRNLWIDTWLAWLIPTQFDGRMPALSGLNFVLLGGALTFTDWVTLRGHRPAQILALAVAALAFETLLNYAYGSPFLYLGAYTRIAFHSAFTFLILSLGVFFLQPEAGLAGEVTSPSLGGLILRRMLLAAICLLPLLGCFRLLAEKAMLVDSAHATSLLVLTSLVTVSILVWRTAKTLNETDRSRTVAEEALRLRNQELTDFFENASVGISWIGPEGTIQWANRAELELLGYGREDYVGRNIAAFYPDTAASDMLIRWKRGEELQNHEMPVVGKDGSTRIVSINSSPHYKNGQLVHTRCFSRDVTQRKAAEEALRISQQKLSAIFNQVAVGIVQADQTGRLVLMNQRFCEIVGRNMEHLLQLRLQDITHPEDWPASMRAFENAVTAGEDCVIEQRYLRANGTSVWVRISVAPVTDADGSRHSVALVEDVSERKRTEAALRKSEDEFRTMFEMAGVGKAQLEPMTRQFLRVNRKLCDITGFPAEELTSRKLVDLIAPEDQAAAAHELDKILQGTQTNCSMEKRFVRKDGQTIWVEISATMVSNSEGKPLRLFAVIQDVTERRQAEDEVRRLNAELDHRVTVRTAQLEATNKELEAFCYSVSHDLRAPLRNIVGFSQALLQDYGDNLDEQGKEYLHRACAAGQRMTRLIEDLLHLSRVGRSEMTRARVDLSSLVQIVAADLQKGEPSRPVSWKIASGLYAQGDSRLLRIAFENLLGNSWKFTSKREETVIEFGQRIQDGQTVFYVRDNGAGFDMTYADKLFGVFQRLHPATEFPGTGIGLATVQRIIIRHGGRIWAEAEVGKGATFYFTLPDA